MNNRKFFSGLSLVLVIALVFIVYTFGFKETLVNPSDKSPKQTSVWASSLYKAYHVNYRQADLLYRDKTVVLHGNLSRVLDINEITTAIFTYQKGPSGEEGVKCVMQKMDASKIQAIKSGMEVNIAGICDGLEGSFVILKDCQLLK